MMTCHRYLRTKSNPSIYVGILLPDPRVQTLVGLAGVRGFVFPINRYQAAR
jgi:hypothetical protein